MDYRTTINGSFTIIDEHHLFLDPRSGFTSTMISTSMIDCYEIIENNIGDEIESEVLSESTIEERISQLEIDQIATNDRIEFVEDCLIEMSETVYGG